MKRNVFLVGLMIVLSMGVIACNKGKSGDGKKTDQRSELAGKYWIGSRSAITTTFYGIAFNEEVVETTESGVWGRIKEFPYLYNGTIGFFVMGTDLDKEMIAKTIGRKDGNSLTEEELVQIGFYEPFYFTENKELVYNNLGYRESSLDEFNEEFYSYRTR
jgi:hypothetical protein